MKNLLILSLIALFQFLPGTAQDEPFSVQPLLYTTNALVPVLSRITIENHHGKHLSEYVRALNQLVQDTPYEKMSVEEILLTTENEAIFNYAAQIFNHNLYFEQLSPYGGWPKGELGIAIRQQWGTFKDFKKEFIRRGNAIFHAAWIWLVKCPDGKLVIVEEEKGNHPLLQGLIPLLGIDLWEHAYYLDYQHHRAEYLENIWDIIDWGVVENRYAQGFRYR